jgi:hypothetical protein
MGALGYAEPAKPDDQALDFKGDRRSAKPRQK